MIRGIHHAALVTPDLEQAKQFYCEVFELEALFDYEWGPDETTFNSLIGMEGTAAKMCLLKGKNSYLELFEYLAPNSEVEPKALTASDRGIRHLAFEVDDVKAVWEKVQAHGGVAMNKPISVPGGLVAVYCRDPFGNIIELIQPGGPMPSLQEA